MSTFDITLKSYRASQREELSSLVKTYQGSLASGENHSLGPLITFFHQVAQLCSISFPDAASDLLLRLYLSDFLDPLSISATEPAKGHSNLQAQCDSLLVVCSESRTSAKYNFNDDPLLALWSLQLPLLPRLELQTRLAERAGVWKLMKPEFINFRVKLVAKVTPVVWEEKMDEQELLIRTAVVADLMEFLGWVSARLIHYSRY